MKDNKGLICGFYLSGDNKGTPIDWQSIPEQLPENGAVWLHFDYTHKNSKLWLEKQGSIEGFICEALLEDETRPRTSFVSNGLLLSLRGVNLNPSSDPEDMVSIRLWSDGKNVISTQRRTLLSINEMTSLISLKKGPESPGQFVAILTESLIDRMKGTIQDIEDKVARIEEIVLDSESYSLRSEIANLRRQAISLRRYLSPQREAMSQLQNDRIDWFTQSDRIHIRETNDSLIRYIEDLDLARDRAAVTQEELVNRLSEQLNKRMYVLSIVAAVFLPLGFLTGLLGINVGGIPGVDNPYAFTIFLFFLVVVVGIQVWIFKIKKWF